MVADTAVYLRSPSSSYWVQLADFYGGSVNYGCALGGDGFWRRASVSWRSACGFWRARNPFEVRYNEGRAFRVLWRVPSLSRFAQNTDKPTNLWNESWLTIDGGKLEIEKRRELAIQNVLHPPKEKW